MLLVSMVLQMHAGPLSPTGVEHGNKYETLFSWRAGEAINEHPSANEHAEHATKEIDNPA